MMTERPAKGSELIHQLLNVSAEIIDQELTIRKVSNHLQIAIGVGSLIGNVFTLAMLIKYEFTSRVTNVYIVSLCISDIFASLFIIYAAVVNQYFGQVELACILVAPFGAVYGVSNFCTLFAAAERYVFMAHPFLHVRYEESRLHQVVVILTWLIMAALGGLTLVDHQWKPPQPCRLFNIVDRKIGIVLVPPLTIIPMFGLAGFSLKLLLLLKRIKQRVHNFDVPIGTISSEIITHEKGDGTAEAPSSSGAVNTEALKVARSVTEGDMKCSIDTSAAVVDAINEIEEADISVSGELCRGEQAQGGAQGGEQSRDVQNPSTLKAERRHDNGKRKTKLVLATVVIALVSWTPFLVLTIIIGAHQPPIGSLPWKVFGECCTLLVYASSLLNPVIYHRFAPQIDRAYLGLFSCFSAR